MKKYSCVLTIVKKASLSDSLVTVSSIVLVWCYLSWMWVMVAVLGRLMINTGNQCDDTRQDNTDDGFSVHFKVDLPTKKKDCFLF